jgi:hypothetical protein
MVLLPARSGLPSLLVCGNHIVCKTKVNGSLFPGGKAAGA